MCSNMRLKKNFHFNPIAARIIITREFRSAPRVVTASYRTHALKSAFESGTTTQARQSDTNQGTNTIKNGLQSGTRE